MQCANATRYTILTSILLILLVSALNAMPPTDEAVAKWQAEGVWEQKVANWQAFKAAGGCAPSETPVLDPKAFRARHAADPDAVDTINVMVILIDFPDYHYDDQVLYYTGGSLSTPTVGTPSDFDSLLFSVRGVDPVSNPTGSMTDFYLENSYGNVLIRGGVHGWYTAPNIYDWYVGVDNGLSGGGDLASHAVDAAMADGVDFTPYANGTQTIEAIVIIHAGPGAETGVYGIWSHQSGIPGNQQPNGLFLNNYTMNPEELYTNLSSMGVFGHEWGHAMGLPDLYDVSYRGAGLGRWSMMAGGSWNDNGRTPAHFDAWSKVALGFVTPTILYSNLADAPLPAVEVNPVIYMLREEPIWPGSETWYVENRQPIGFDVELPGHGLCIYHFDPLAPNNGNPNRYRVALEQADGLDQLAAGSSSGDQGDSWPGSTNNRNFHDFTIPNAMTNEYDDTSTVGVWNISDSDSLMTADLEVEYAHPYLVLYGDAIRFTDETYGDNNGVFEAGETIEVWVTVRNLMGQSFHPAATLSCDDPRLIFTQNDVSFAGDVLNPTIYPSETVIPILFDIPSDYSSRDVSFSLSVVSDKEFFPAGDRTFETVFDFSLLVGKPEVLLVDDDNGQTWESYYSDAFARLRTPMVHWDKNVSGSPTGADLTPYKYVFWMTGTNVVYPGGTITAADVTAMKEFLDASGNLVLASIHAGAQLQVLDSAFMADYLKANVVGNATANHFRGVGGSMIGDTLTYRYDNNAYLDINETILSAVNGGEGVYDMVNQSGTVTYGTAGVAYSGSYRSVFLNFPIEFVGDMFTPNGFMPKDSLLLALLSFMGKGSATSVDSETRVLLPKDYELEQNYPNPFNPTTTITYAIGTGKPRQTVLSIYNLLGREVRTLVNKVQGPGDYRVEWDGSTASGSPVASGIYLYRLARDGSAITRKMILMK